jgi:hypothetical protein
MLEMSNGCDMNIAQKVREAKERFPEDFCPVKDCLWRIHTARGESPCQYHPVAIERVLVASVAIEKAAKGAVMTQDELTALREYASDGKAWVSRKTFLAVVESHLRKLEEK